MKNIFYWLPRILSLLFVAFLSLFALDVFSEYQGWELIIALAIHLIPSFVLLVTAIIAWKFDLVGVVVFLGAAILYVWNAGFDKPWSWYAFIAGPAALVGLLYLGNFILRKSTSKTLEKSSLQ